ncbi:acyltransferase [Konateibacter massiliensis]|uniref:acyltransferase n=1 Tax=Konateibacter massiliensis TaxID=2002841 RepID=UPI000C158F81|nr:acyltransferase [Konateibacter massiliensis]
MKRIIRAGICEVFTICKFVWKKIFNGSKFKFGIINICSPFSEVEISKGGRIEIGEKFRMRGNCHLRVRKDGNVIIGKNVTWNYGCMVVSHKKIKIGDNVQFGPNVLIYDHDHDFRVQGGLNNKDFIVAPVEIGNNVWIGANSVILRGTKIGNNCIVGAGTVLKGEYADNSVIVQKRETAVTNI